MIDVRNSNILYVSGHRHKSPGGFFKSIDGGATWKEAEELKKEAIHAMVQSSKDPNMLLVGSVNGIWVSRDSGDTWNKYSSSTAPVKLDALAIDPRDADTIYAGTWWRAYKTIDGGKNWRLIKRGMIDDSDVFAIDINPQNPDHVVASACSGIYQSFNKGEKWKKIQGIPSRSRRTRAILQNPYRPGAVYAGTTEGFWMSSNGGKTWALRTSRRLEVNAIALHPSNPDTIYIATNNYGVMVSRNGGRSFEQNNGNFSSRFTKTITPDIEIPERLYATTINTATGGGFIFISEDSGRTWKPSSKNIDTRRTIVYSLVQDKINPNLIYLATQAGLYKSLDRGVMWNRIASKKPKKAQRRRTRRGKRRAKIKSKAIVKPKDTPKGTVAALTGKVNTLIHTQDGKNGYFAATNKGLYRSYDIAKGWQKINLGDGVSGQIFSVHVSDRAPGVIWVGTSVSGVLVSKDDGLTWNRVGADLIPLRVPINTIVTKPDNPDHVFVGTVQTLYMSKDGGETWRRRGGNLPLGNYNSIIINPKNTDEVFAASALESNGGIFHSTDSGEVWERIDRANDLASTRVWSLMFNPNNQNELLAGTHSSGIYRIGRTLHRRAVPIRNTSSNASPVKSSNRVRIVKEN